LTPAAPIRGNEHQVQNLKTVFYFALKYLRPYWARFVLGVVLGCLCGLTASAFVWATGALAERLQKPKVLAAAELETKERKARRPSLAVFPNLDTRLQSWRKSLDETIDPWLPRLGATLDWRRILGGLMLLPLIAAVRGTTDYLSNYCMAWVSERVSNDLRGDILGKLTSLSLDYFNRSTTGDMLTRINTDTANLHRAMRQGTADLFKESFTMLSVLVMLLLVDWKLTASVLVLVPMIVLPLLLLGKRARNSSRAGRRATVRQSSLLVEALTGIRVLKAFNLEGRQVERFRDISRQMIRYGMKGTKAKELVNPIIEFVAAIGVGALIVYLFWTRQSLPDLVKFVSGVAFFFVPVKKIAAIHILFEQAGAGVERIVDLLQEKPSIMEVANPKPFKKFEREIRFENVSFSYGERPVLRDINLRIPRGMKVGIAGESGSGKSTMVNLLFRFYDVSSGRITIDGIDIREMSFEDLRRPMALVSQDVFVFRTTVAENIAVGRSGATREEIQAAAQAANAHHFVMNLAQGYDTMIGERGMTISGGQRQRLAIARAFVRNAPILVLDEATASLDSQSEAEVQAAIDRLEENRTVICVAHRLSTLANMDHVIVLSKDGRIVEQGSFDELVQARGIFAEMAARQGIFATA
jgi:ABC-type multidrug transport system fused ATPase/permease subunit